MSVKNFIFILSAILIVLTAAIFFQRWFRFKKLLKGEYEKSWRNLYNASKFYEQYMSEDTQIVEEMIPTYELGESIYKFADENNYSLTQAAKIKASSELKLNLKYLK